MVMTVVLLLGGVAILVGGYLLAVHRARAAADLGALSGAAAVAAGQDPCLAARTVVARHGARISRCDHDGDQIDYVVTVAVTVAVPATLPGLPRSVGALGSAGPVDLARTG